jgi:hypothetical protein
MGTGGSLDPPPRLPAKFTDAPSGLASRDVFQAKGKALGKVRL